jgi:SAM-dependent methyltransferase
MKKKLFFAAEKLTGYVKIIAFFFKRIFDKAFFELNTIETYFRQDECASYKDCRLLYRLLKNQPPASDRYIEYPWMVENIRTMKSGKILDIGSTICDRLFAFLPKTVEIHGINLNDKPIKNDAIKFKTGDIRKTDYPNDFFDCITCISTLEHIGVSGRYGSDEDKDGDVKAMREMKRILKPNGILLVTVPYGAQDVLPINKLYSKERIKNLYEGFEIVSQEFHKFNSSWRTWIKVSEEEAHTADMLKDRWYALSLIKARKK